MRLLAGTSVLLSMTLLCGYSYLYATNQIKPLTTASIEITELPDAPPTAMPFPQATRVTGITVHISSNAGLATGVVIDRQTILTVAHVVGTQKLVMVDVGRYERHWLPARVVGKISATGEDIILLQLIGDKQFYNKQNFKMGSGIRIPRWLVTPVGVFDWNPGIIVPGDSGGAVLNTDGELIGLVTGYTTAHRRNVATLFN